MRTTVILTTLMFITFLGFSQSNVNVAPPDSAYVRFMDSLNAGKIQQGVNNFGYMPSPAKINFSNTNVSFRRSPNMQISNGLNSGKIISVGTLPPAGGDMIFKELAGADLQSVPNDL